MRKRCSSGQCREPGGRGPLEGALLGLLSLLLAFAFNYVILDLDRPRRGIIETSAAHQNMIDILQTVSANGGSQP